MNNDELIIALANETMALAEEGGVQLNPAQALAVVAATLASIQEQMRPADHNITA